MSKHVFLELTFVKFLRQPEKDDWHGFLKSQFFTSRWKKLRIQLDLSYYYYLKALELNPNDAYAKKGIAWIIFSYEKNPEEALRILDAITENYSSPDYYLLKAEIADYMGSEEIQAKNLDLYFKSVFFFSCCYRCI